MGITTKIPQKRINLYSYGDSGYTEYVGGDAYNIQIEASLRGGQISGAKAAKSVYISCSALLFVFSLSLLTKREQSVEDGCSAAEAPVCEHPAHTIESECDKESGGQNEEA